MYYATNINPILEAMEAKKPRTVRQMYEDYYGSCVTFDKSGRAHAPHDGYVCDVTGKLYRGGEYLPTPPDEDGFKMSYVKDKIKGCTFYIDGEVVYVNGTAAQRRAGIDVAKMQTYEHDRNTNYVGSLGHREELNLRVIAIFEETSAYGGKWSNGRFEPQLNYTHELRDKSGNRIVYKGSKKLTDYADGQDISLKATIKSHYTTKDGRKITYIQRPTII